MRKVVFLLLTLTASAFVFSQEDINKNDFELDSNKNMLDINSLLPSQVVQELIENGEVQRNFYGEKNISLELAPSSDLGYQAKNYWQRNKEPVFIVESLYLLEKKPVDHDAIDEISLLLRNLSKMTGIEYFSNSRQVWETLYTDVYTVNNPTDKQKIEDPINENIENLTSYVYQKDRSLSGTVYEFSYFINESEVSFRAINTENIRYGGFPFPIVNKNNLVLTLIATDVGDSVLFYVLVQADVPKIPFVSERLAKSFSSRADAIFKWCFDMYNTSE